MTRDGRSFPFVVMEWVQGRLLYEWARAQKPTSRELLQVLAQLASALATVHEAGGVHRDVKGDNILVTRQGRAVLLDWGCGTYEGAKAITDTVLLACLSEDRRARPPAAALAIGLSAAADDQDALKPLTPTPAAANTERTSHPGPRRRFAVPAWLSLASAAIVGGLLVAAALELRRVPLPDPGYWAVEEQRHTPSPSPEAPDAGVGDETPTSAVNVPRVGVPLYALGLPMPKKPQPGQRKPPCDRGETAIHGACWVRVWGEDPPCGQKMFEYEGGCYFASFDGQRQPTSEEPR